MKELLIKILTAILKKLQQDQQEAVFKEIQDRLAKIKVEAHDKISKEAEEGKESIYYAIDNVVKDKANKIKFISQEFTKIDKFGLIPNAVSKPIYDISNHIDDHIEMARQSVDGFIDEITEDMCKHVDSAQSDDAVNTLVSIANDRFKEAGEAFINKLICKYTI
jgi:hypothetical protein